MRSCCWPVCWPAARVSRDVHHRRQARPESRRSPAGWRPDVWRWPRAARAGAEASFGSNKAPKPGSGCAGRWAGSFEIASDGERISVTDAAGQVLGADARATPRSRLGADLPLSSLRYWMIGLPDPIYGQGDRVGSHAVADHRAARLDDRLRRVYVSGFALPARVTATSGDVRLRLTVGDWTDLRAAPR